jgi:hypothetical protein
MNLDDPARGRRLDGARLKVGLRSGRRARRVVSFPDDAGAHEDYQLLRRAMLGE